MSFASAAQRLLGADPAARLQVAQDMRERIEIVHTSEYKHFLRALFPAVKTLLQGRAPTQAGGDAGAAGSSAAIAAAAGQPLQAGGEHAQLQAAAATAVVASAPVYRVAPSLHDTPDHKLRNVLLEVLNRLPNNEVLKPFVPELLQVSYRQRVGEWRGDAAMVLGCLSSTMQ